MAEAAGRRGGRGRTLIVPVSLHGISPLMLKLQGIFPPIATPFDHNGDLYAAKVKHNVEKWNLTALSGYVVCGSTGESVMLTAEEKIAAVGMGREVRRAGEAADRRHRRGERARDRLPHQPRGRDGLQGRHGAHAALLQEPAEQRRRRRRSTSARWPTRAKIPLMIYNWPQATGLDIPPEAVAALSEHPNIIAIKESSGNLEKVMQMIREVKPGFQVLVGSAPTLWPSFVMGAWGQCWRSPTPRRMRRSRSGRRTARGKRTRRWTGRTASGARPRW